MYENKYLDADGVSILMSEVRRLIKNSGGGGTSSLKFKYEETVDFVDVVINATETSPGNVILSTTGIDITETEPGHVSMQSSYMKVIDDGLGNVAIRI